MSERRAPRAWAAAVEAHPRHVVLAAVVAGLALGPRVPVVAWWAGAVAVAVAVVAAWGAGAAGGRIAAVLAIAATALPLAGVGAQARLAALDRTALGPWLGHASTLTAVVLQPARPRSFGRWVALVRVRAGPGRGERVLVERHGPLDAPVGAEVLVRGGWRPLPSFEAAMRRAGAHALLRADDVTPTGRRRDGLSGAIDRVRERAEAALARGVPIGLGGLARGMVLGEDAGLSPATVADFRASGLAHLVAASGANVALLAALVLALGALAGVPRTARLVIALVVVAGYVPLAGGGPSIQRAGIMGAAAILAALASQPASRWYALLLAAAMTLALNPRALEDVGWQLSFAAVVALVALAPPLRSALARRLPAGIADALAVCLVASAATAPLIALHFGRLSWVTLPANLVAVPAVAPIMWLGVAAAAVGQVSADLAAPLMAFAQWPLAFVAWAAHAAAGLPGANAEAHLSAAGTAAWGVVLLALAVPRVRRVFRPVLGTAGVPRAGRVAAGLGLGLAAVVGLIALPGAGGVAPPPGPSVSALDVGQGDATLIRAGGHAILVDAGPPDGPILDRLRELGVGRLDLLVVTHAQADHEGGAAAVLAALPVGLVLDGRDGVRSPEGDAFAAMARRRGVRLLAPEAGQRLRAGPIVLDVLSPRAEPAARHAGADPNQRAIVAEARAGELSILLTADAESDVLAALPLEPVTVLKVSHHGSADPGLPALLARLHPAAALIEVGRHNVYGHPAPATAAALAAAVPRVYRTDRDGTVTLRAPP